MNRRTLLIALALLGTPACFSLSTSPVALEPLDQQVWSDEDYRFVLAEYVDGEGLVDYVGLGAHRRPLDAFVARLAFVGPKTYPDLFPTRDDELAYSINAYNALVLFNVINRYPIASVHDSLYDFFYFTCFVLDGEETNLFELEERIREYGDPRVHFALNCASASCPRLPDVPFTGADLRAELQRETAAFLDDDFNLLVITGGPVVLSKIFAWYSGDFPGGVVPWIREQRPGVLPSKASVCYRKYDWSLNDQGDPPVRKPLSFPVFSQLDCPDGDS